MSNSDHFLYESFPDTVHQAPYIKKPIASRTFIIYILAFVAQLDDALKIFTCIHTYIYNCMHTYIHT